jgi:anti-sigma B factor antagonist
MRGMGEGALPGQPAFELSVTALGDVRVVTLSGELDIDTMGEVSDALATANGLATTVVDLRELTFIDSSGVSGLMSAARRATEAGAWMCCVPGPPSVQRVFELTGVDTVLDWVDDPASAAAGPPAD